ncbi:lytic transglycosylase domain-containing protein [uncultured Microscilla sp.]|uniref:lytic transglycosylase domain-containing protein n=1 Tax=uncultured Microscilla sp. TaxID=432653 RepID=UPI002627DB03|nr:lytic transglycosylase domain-containing protein [uncultured Microscilla sp.]
MKNTLLVILLLVNLGLAGYILTSQSQASNQPTHPSTGAPAPQAFKFTSVPIPSSVSFAGEKVPLQDPEVRERLEQELVQTAYRHSRTIMNYKRAGRWFPQIVPILKKNNIPEDFKYIAVVESNLLNLISRVGATGFWQFMRATGKQYKLEVNKEVDERYHRLKATKAACRYLNDAHGIFGNWALVAASYNRGMGGIRSNVNRQKVASYYDLFLNAETAKYVIRAVAVKLIFENPQSYGFNIPAQQRYQPIDYRKVTVTESIPDLVDFAIKQGISYKILKVHNPWLRSKTLTIKKTGASYTILIPKDAKPNEPFRQEDIPKIRL